MNAKRCCRIPRELFDWIKFLAQSLPARSVRTFIELLLGVMLTPAGSVTEAYLMLDMRNHWTSYYKWLQKGKCLHHQHGNKPNLAKYVRGRCFVSPTMVVRRGARQFVAIPLLCRLSPSAGNTGKLRAAQVLIRAIYERFSGRQVRVLMDSWYERCGVNTGTTKSVAGSENDA